MAIENINNRIQNPGVTKLPNNTKQEKSGESNKNTGSDSIEITSVAQELKTSFESLVSIPIVNFERVEAAKMAIASGNYSISADTIAEKIIQLEKTLPNDST